MINRNANSGTTPVFIKPMYDNKSTPAIEVLCERTSKYKNKMQAIGKA